MKHPFLLTLKQILCTLVTLFCFPPIFCSLLFCLSFLSSLLPFFNLKQNYTCDWPLLSSVSVDMLEDDDDDDDFECDDDDFLVGNNAGSTLSIGDSGVGK